jgi:hypothetical protein
MQECLYQKMHQTTEIVSIVAHIKLLERTVRFNNEYRVKNMDCSGKRIGAGV